METKSWESRLSCAATRGLPRYHKSAPTFGVVGKMTLARCNEKTEHEYEMEVEVCGTYEPAQRGGRTDPSWDAHMTDGTAFWHRPGKGWVELDLTRDEQEQVEQHLMRPEYDY